MIVGLASYGQSTYESVYNGGMGAMVLPPARHDIFSHEVAERYPETYDASLPEEVVYVGKRGLTEPVEGLRESIMVALCFRPHAPMLLWWLVC